MENSWAEQVKAAGLGWQEPILTNNKHRDIQTILQ